MSVVRTIGTSRGLNYRRFGLVIGLILCGELAVLQASLLDGLLLNPFALFDDGLGPAEVGSGGCNVTQALMVSSVIVMFDEGLDPDLEIALQEVVFQQAAVF